MVRRFINWFREEMRSADEAARKRDLADPLPPAPKREPTTLRETLWTTFGSFLVVLLVVGAMDLLKVPPMWAQRIGVGTMIAAVGITVLTWVAYNDSPD